MSDEGASERPKRTANVGKVGGGAYLNAGHIGPRGREFPVVDTSWEENYAKDALIPTLHLEGNPEAGEEENILFKMTTKGNNSALDAAGAGGEDLSPMVGTSVYVQVVMVTAKDGSQKKSLQIAEILRDGRSIWTATKA